MGSDGDSCSSDSQCTCGADGRCLGIALSAGPESCFCSYDTCATDTDCKAGDLCVCHGSAYQRYSLGNTCVVGNCRVDADCGEHAYCSPARGYENCGCVTGYYCHTRQDLCTNDNDCEPQHFCTWFSKSARWGCELSPMCGMPPCD